MANWQRRLNLGDVWDKVDTGELTVQQLSAIVAERLKRLKDFGDEHLDDQKADIVDEFEGLSTDPNADVEDFDNVLHTLYDWGDTPLDNDYLVGKKVCWIDTISKKEI